MKFNSPSLILPLVILSVAGCSKLPVSQEAPPPMPTAKPDELRQPLMVNSIADGGPGSLRDAISRANATPGMDRILFDSDATLFRQPQQITLTSPLPEITDDLLIDGFIDNMLWQASGVTLSGNHRYRVFRVAAAVTADIRHLTLADGRADNGAGILNRGETVLEGVSLLNHSATQNGGAIHNSGRLWLINSTLAGNTAGLAGGGLYNHTGQVTVTNATFTRNRAAQGAALYNQGDILMANSILTGNLMAADCASESAFDTPVRRNIISRHEGCGSPFSNQDVQLGQLGYYNGPTQTIPISGRSLAVNHGNNRAAIGARGAQLVWDQRGNGDPRFTAGITDIGAFEIQARIVLQVDTLDSSDKRWCTNVADDCSLSGALQIAAASPRLSTISFQPDLFAQPVTLKLDGGLPDIDHPIVIDASDVARVTISGADKRWKKPLSEGQLILKNARFTNGS
ncbi:hypothetical protein KDX31_19685 (plasmid) [Amphritea atlantica]|uniref:Polymorphic outer membrane protein repeat-containing protein n=1 Tax=Amphritea atlantica TaxID=355243 RepID=A0ABY5H0A3_9GAMM|nr:hypothetical protein KDX31_19685 [Amphritea atlantica]